MLDRFLFKYIDNSPLIVFRIIFGLLIFIESIGAIFTGWVKRILIDPKFTFSFIGFEWLQPLPENWMYLYYVVMGIFGLFVMFGYKYRFSIIAFTLLWTATYLMQKSAYNNHYYLLIILSFLMIFQPANTYLSVDAKKNPSIVNHAMPQWCKYVIILQMAIVYIYGAIAKIYPDWLDTTVVEIFMSLKQHYYIIGDFIQLKGFHYFIAYSGIAFDLLVVPLLLWKRTRKFAFFASIFFHLFNSIVFQVGIFPYLSLAISLFFFEPKTVRNIFLRKKPIYEADKVIIPKSSKYIIALLLIFFSVQIVLPLRHWVIKDDVLWTEEGHRMSWRMMLRSKVGTISYRVFNTSNNSIAQIELSDYLTNKQIKALPTNPDMIWQFAQYLKKSYKDKGIDIKVFVSSSISVNRKPFKRFIDPNIDLASVSWNVFKHNEWILPSKRD
jgi:hypothetical protein